MYDILCVCVCVCVLIITRLWFQTYKWKKTTLVARAFYWFLKHTMIFHNSGLLLLLLVLILTHLSMARNYVFT